MRNQIRTRMWMSQVRLLLSPTPDGHPLPDRHRGRQWHGEGPGPDPRSPARPIAVLSPRSSTLVHRVYPLDEAAHLRRGVVGLEVIGTGEDGLAQQVGLTRTPCPGFPEVSVSRPDCAWLWPVTTVPTGPRRRAAQRTHGSGDGTGWRLSRIIRPPVMRGSPGCRSEHAADRRGHDRQVRVGRTMDERTTGGSGLQPPSGSRRCAKQRPPAGVVATATRCRTPPPWGGPDGCDDRQGHQACCSRRVRERHGPRSIRCSPGPPAPSPR